MINFIQLDPNGLCNAGCWFCPVSTLRNPKNQINQMDINLFDKIISEIVNLKGDLINPNLHFIYCSHYNEVLLYKHFESMLKILNKNKLSICILTNGVPLTPKKIDLINKHQPAVSMIAINAPVYEKRLFEKRTGMKEVMFDKLIRNIDYASNNLYNPNLLLLHINGINEHSNIIKLKNFPDLEKNEMQNQVAIAQKLFPSIKIYEQWNLIDRAGLLKDVMLNKSVCMCVCVCVSVSLDPHPHTWYHTHGITPQTNSHHTLSRLRVKMEARSMSSTDHTTPHHTLSRLTVKMEARSASSTAQLSLTMAFVACVCACVRVCMKCMCTCACAFSYSVIDTHALTHTHTHTHTHTWVHTCQHTHTHTHLVGIK